MIYDGTSVDLREKGRDIDGQPQMSNRRLYIQFLAFQGTADPEELSGELRDGGVTGTLYLDLNNPRGYGLAWAHEDPSFFTDTGRKLLSRGGFKNLEFRPHLTMTGRTYALGYEADLEETLFTRPAGRLLDPAYPWAIWYPVKRKKDFESLDEKLKHDIMMNHGEIGKVFGKSGAAADIRLACHGLDENDSDFIIGVLGTELIGPSSTIQAMRKSLQTMHHLENLGPFFTGKVYSRFSS